MTRNSNQTKNANGKRQSIAVSLVPAQQQQNGRRVSVFMNAHRRLSLVSQISMAHGAEYRPQQRLPPNGLESKYNVLLTATPIAVEHDLQQLCGKPKKKSKSKQQNGLFSDLSNVADNELKCGHDTKGFQC